MKKLMHLGMLSALIALLSFMLPAQVDAQKAFDSWWNPTQAEVQRTDKSAHVLARKPSFWNHLLAMSQSRLQSNDKNHSRRAIAQRNLMRPKTATATPRKAPKVPILTIPEDKALVTLEVEGHPYDDGSGFTLLFDADAQAYDYYHNELNDNWWTDGYNIDVALWNMFDAFLPEDTENDYNTDKVIVDSEASTLIAAGIYDFVVGCPTPGDAYYKMPIDQLTSGNSLRDNFEFEGGKSYRFYVHKTSDGQACDLYVNGELYGSEAEEGKAHVTLSVIGDPYEDGTKFQLYIDADGNFDYEAWSTAGSDEARVAAVEGCEYRIPEGATPEAASTIGVFDDFQTIDLDPGTYDFAIANPYGDDVFIGLTTSMLDDFELEAGHDYTFVVRKPKLTQPYGEHNLPVLAIYKDGVQLTDYDFGGDQQPLYLQSTEGFSVWANDGQLTPDNDGIYWITPGDEVFFVPNEGKDMTDVELYANASSGETVDYNDTRFCIYTMGNGYPETGFNAVTYLASPNPKGIMKKIDDLKWQVVFNRVAVGQTYEFFFSSLPETEDDIFNIFGFFAGNESNNPAVFGQTYTANYATSPMSQIVVDLTNALEDPDNPGCSLTITLNLRNFNPDTKEGATYKVEAGEPFDEQVGNSFCIFAPTDYSNSGCASTVDIASVNPISVLTEVSDRVFEITYDDVLPTNYMFAICNTEDGSLFSALTAATSYPTSGQTYDAYYSATLGSGGSPLHLQLTNMDNTYNVTIRLDLTNFDPETKEGATYTVTYTENSAEQEPVIEDILSVGIIGTTSLVNGTESFTPSEADLMEQDPDNENIYTITYEDIAADDVYDFKFCFNGDANLTLSTNSQDFEYGFNWQEAVWNGDQAIVASPDGSGLIRVTLKLDLSEFDPMTGGGAKYWFEYEPMPRRLVWDFAGTDFSEADKKKMDADNDSWKYDYDDDRAENLTSVGLYPLAQGRPISWTSGLEFDNIAAGKLRLDHNKSLNMNGKNLGFLIPVKAGDRLVIIAANAGNSGERGLAASNLAVESGFELVTGTEDVTNSGIVEEDGYVNIATVGGGINIKKIEIIPADQQQSKSFVFLKPSNWNSYMMVYAWDNNGEPLLGDWPGAQLSYFENFLGEGDAGQYWRITVPAGAVGIVLSDDPNGHMNQTVDITDFTHDYQTTGLKDNFGHWEVTTFNYVANGD